MNIIRNSFYQNVQQSEEKDFDFSENYGYSAILGNASITLNSKCFSAGEDTSTLQAPDNSVWVDYYVYNASSKIGLTFNSTTNTLNLINNSNNSNKVVVSYTADLSNFSPVVRRDASNYYILYQSKESSTYTINWVKISISTGKVASSSEVVTSTYSFKRSSNMGISKYNVVSFTGSIGKVYFFDIVKNKLVTTSLNRSEFSYNYNDQAFPYYINNKTVWLFDTRDYGIYTLNLNNNLSSNASATWTKNNELELAKDYLQYHTNSCLIVCDTNANSSNTTISDYIFVLCCEGGTQRIKGCAAIINKNTYSIYPCVTTESTGNVVNDYISGIFVTPDNKYGVIVGNLNVYVFSLKTGNLIKQYIPNFDWKNIQFIIPSITI